MTSAENPEGIASHPLTAALPAFHRSFSLFSAILLPSACHSVSLRYRIELGQRNLANQRRGQQLPCERPGGERNCSPPARAWQAWPSNKVPVALRRGRPCPSRLPQAC